METELEQLSRKKLNDLIVLLNMLFLPEVEEPSGMLTGEDSIEYYIDSDGKRAWKFSWSSSYSESG